MIYGGIPAVVLIWSVYSAVFVDNIRAVVTDDGFLEVYQKNKQTYRFKISETPLSYSICSTTDDAGTDDDCRLIILNKDTCEEEDYIDFSMFGRDRFEEFVEYIGLKTNEPLKVETKVKE